MQLLLKRHTFLSDCTLGSLYIDGRFECYTLEDTDRGLRQDMPVNVLLDKKVKGQTAIPYGRYKIDMNTVSPKYSKREQYNFCGAKLPRLNQVPAYSGILIHIGNYNRDTEGCILVGRRADKKIGMISDSTAAFRSLMSKLAGGEHEIEIIKEER